jgi:hypothetical protein
MRIAYWLKSLKVVGCRNKKGSSRQPVVMRRMTAVRLIAIAAVSMIVGCGRSGPEVHYVEGVVLLDDEPLAGATVGFNPDGSGKPAFGNTDQKGVFKLTTTQGGGRDQGAALGSYVVLVSKWRNRLEGLGPRPDGADAKALAEWLSQEKAIEDMPPDYIVPKAYGDKATSGLKATVKSGRNVGPEFRYELKSDFTGK